MVNQLLKHVRRTVAAGAVAAAASLSLPQAHGSSALPLTLPQLTHSAALIADATVQSVQCFWATPSGAQTLRTKVTFQVNQAVKGNPGPTFTLEFLGGQVGQQSLSVEGVPQFQPGGRYIIFSESPDKAVVCPILGLDQGALRVVHDQQSNVDRVFRHWGQPVNGREDFAGRIPAVAGLTTRDYLRTADTVPQFLARVYANQ
ncbi:MAG: hypothetical protein JO015_13795 [Verrucomicrobia bacterium]|nr:hypothetical protein [Verrucomicrobiota bacterium]